jgi:serine/threonine-protein kinase
VAQVFLIGRSEDCSIRFDDSAVSRQHAELVLTPGGKLLLQDLGSGNGTYLEGRRLPSDEKAQVNSGDAIVVGANVLRVTIIGAEIEPLRPVLDFLPPDEYEILGQLGEGASSTVFAVRQKLLDRLVAIKVMRADIQEDDPRWARFLREGAVCCRLQSPYVVEVHNIRPGGERVYLVMELVNGPTATDVLASGPLSVAEALRIATDVAKGLAAVHAAGVIHRDVKPSNIFLSPKDGVAKLGQFSCAKDLQTDDEITDSKFALGSLPYVSPEQARDPRTADVRSDLYGLGATLYHFLTGRAPFAGSAGTLVRRILNEPPDPPILLRPECPGDVSNLVMGLLEKDPAARPPSAKSVVRQLAELADLHSPNFTSELLKKPSNTSTAKLPHGFYRPLDRRTQI